MGKKINSRAKGAAGERELSSWLRSKGIKARRGQQFSGGVESPDIVADLPAWHIECKRVESLALYDALEQAKRDCSKRASNLPKHERLTPVVFHRKNNKEWVAVLRAEDFIELVRPPSALLD